MIYFLFNIYKALFFPFSVWNEYLNQDLKFDKLARLKFEICNWIFMDLTPPQSHPPLSKTNISQAKPEPRDLTQA